MWMISGFRSLLEMIRTSLHLDRLNKVQIEDCTINQFSSTRGGTMMELQKSNEVMRRRSYRASSTGPCTDHLHFMWANWFRNQKKISERILGVNYQSLNVRIRTSVTFRPLDKYWKRNFVLGSRAIELILSVIFFCREGRITKAGAILELLRHPFKYAIDPRDYCCLPPS